MSNIRIRSIKIKNYRSFKDEEYFEFPDITYKKPISIVGYNNSGKTNLMNCILYGVGEKFVNQETFDINDFYKKDFANIPSIESDLEASSFGVDKIGKPKTIEGQHKISIFLDDKNTYISEASVTPSFFGKNKEYNIFYINFHNIKDEISTQKTSWGNLKSFLAKHIKKLVDEDTDMNGRKEDFKDAIKKATNEVLNGQENKSNLLKFVDKIKENYNQNLRDNNVEIDFSLPDYEDIFLQMMFKIGLDGNKDNFVPVNHFGDGYISMFVMAVIQAIAEENIEDKCLFLFEEPESFLHENHQEYFYKMVLCSLTEKEHQVIYTTHSDKMVDIFDTRGLIRLEMENNHTVKKYNNPDREILDKEGIVNLKKYNEFIKTIEPNLNKILFSKKVILVEGPNDLMVYKYCIQKKVEEIIKGRVDIKDKIKYAKTYLNFQNISIIPHHGKSTAIYLIDICKHFGLDYFVINDLDFEDKNLDLDNLNNFNSLKDMQEDSFYKGLDSNKKGMLTTNFNLLKAASKEKIHFNIPKLENIIGYSSEDKNSLNIYNLISKDEFAISEDLFPVALINFIGLGDNFSEDVLNEEMPF